MAKQIYIYSEIYRRILNYSKTITGVEYHQTLGHVISSSIILLVLVYETFTVVLWTVCCKNNKYIPCLKNDIYHIYVYTGRFNL